MKRILLYSILIITGILYFSCDDFFDVVPENAPKLDDSFSNRTMMERGLYTAYSYLPDPTDQFYFPAYYNTGGEFSANYNSPFGEKPSQQIYKGFQNTNSVQQNYWSGGNGGTSMFQALRWCNIFLENAYVPRDITEKERARWIAEVKFLKAYYHFFLLQLYGPIPLIKENIPLDAQPDEVKIYREPVDECIDYIVELIDEASPDLPLYIVDPTNELGRITQPIALAIKAKALVWGASPLFNGNSYYSRWIDSRGKQLIPSQPDNSKWERAVDALKDAIDNAHSAGHSLFSYNKSTESMHNMNDSIVQLMTIREAITKKWNTGVIWSSTKNFTGGKSGFAGSDWGNMQHDLYPMLYTDEITRLSGHFQAAFEMAELFYSKNGVPIDEDKQYDYNNRYKPRTGDDNHKFFIVKGEQTGGLNFDREYRFYADLAFDRGYYEINTGTADNGRYFSTYLKCLNTSTDWNNQRSRTGYHVKKMVSFRTSGSQGTNKSFSTDNYRFPLIRLADLYLLYSEALNEVKSAPDDEVYYWMDLVREKAGLGKVADSWQKYSNMPWRITDKDEMRKIIHQERLIELAFEGQRFWDVRRWHEANIWFTQVPKCWDKTGKTPADYYLLMNLDEAPRFVEKDYLWPISTSDLRINNNLVQSYGW